MKRKSINLLLVMIGFACISCSNTLKDSSEGKIITILDIPGVVTPINVDELSKTYINTFQYNGHITLTSSDDFLEKSTIYTASIELTAKDGWTFNGIEENSFTIAGAETTNKKNSSIIQAIFNTSSGTLDYESRNIGILKYIPKGSFQRDATIGNISKLTSGYHMGQFEITRAQFLAIMGSDPSSSEDSSGINDPVQGVNWYQAIAFCNKLSILEGFEPIYSVKNIDFEKLVYSDIPQNSNQEWDNVIANWSNNGYRLPTEMEWMWAAIGAPIDGQDGSVNLTGYTKSFSGSNGTNSIDNYVWYNDNSSLITHPVGTKKYNELGLYDMSGNVFEWCWDWYDSNPSGLLVDSHGPNSGTYRVDLGNSCINLSHEFTIAARRDDYPDNRISDHGFRVVRP